MELSPGQVFAGQYRVERVLSESADGTVYAARSDRLLKGVALKVIDPLLTPSPEAAARIVRDATAVSQLGHPGIIEVLEAGVHEGAAWLAMEQVEGESLAQRMKWGRPLAPRDALNIADQLLAALEVAHAAGHVHHDLSPECVLVQRGTERAKIRDFGVTPSPSAEITGQTATAAALGVPAYVAPELATSATNVTPAVDVYGVGAILFELLSGQKPYEATTLGQLVQLMHNRGARKLKEVSPTLDPGLSAAVDRMLAVDPSARPGSASEARSLLAALGGTAAAMPAFNAAPPNAAPPNAVTGPAAAAPPVAATMALDSGALPQNLGAPGFGVGTPPHGGVTPAQPPASGFGAGAPPPGGFGGPTAPPHAGFGQPPGGPAPVVAATPPAQKSSGSGWLIALAVIGGGVLVLGLIVVLGAGAGVYYFLQEGAPGPGPEPPPPLPSPIVSVSSLGLPGATAERVRIATDDAPARGGAEPLVTIVTFSDFQCPFCARVSPTMAQVQQNYGDQVRYVWRDNPLSFHEEAMPAAEAAREAFAQGGDDRFWAMHGALFANQQALDRASLERYAAGSGVDLNRLRIALDNHTHQFRIRADMAAATTANARGTPAFFINGRHVRGAQPYAQFSEVIDEEVALANALIARGVQRRDLYATFQRDALTSPPPEPSPTPTPTPTPRPSDDTRYNIPIPARAPSWGAANAPVTIQIFSDFQCPFCSRVVPTVARIRETYPGRVRIVWRNYPLPFHQRAMPAAQAAMEVFEQGGDDAFWRYHDILFENQRQLEDANLVAYAQQVPGVTGGRISQALASQRQRARVQSDMDAIQTAGARIGTPSFFINGLLLQGAQPFERFRQVIDEELNRPH